MKLNLILVALSVSSAAFVVHAADGARAERLQAELQKRFTAADANGDGRLTRDEAKGKMPRVYEHFDEIDSAHAGSISVADITAFVRAQRGAKGDK